MSSKSYLIAALVTNPKFLFGESNLKIAKRLLKKAIEKAAEDKRESYAMVKTKEHGRSTFHGDMTVVVVFMDHASLKT
ncbi:hypothetical protein PIB30_063914 [Stylosanthes scabra]|uniref:Protein-serine/threonine phosphatase n=1 Tax=Stylosanthes scabra TaxID=79078 RepID=A0ABU6UQB7_9FABA|nr:hypothetical protein [Stylosanthes scabra]